ncbi:ATP-binding protein [Sphingomonas sp. AOB5]|uniref:sensor histidine kinase NtrY-like n=1 Tax=Sphingomonas sp. AOB5 TaxID=3034017 RepID=UPI0023F9798D|nr:ATP-binding protein [Sphingomonas sp. AOB5]MDF7773921.1 ATP-binding protein [Sphingomonas sp. AOB5]
MDAVTTPITGEKPQKRWFSVTPAIELAVLGVAAATLYGTYLYISGQRDLTGLLSPVIAAFLLLANLLPAVVLIILLGRRIARNRAAKAGMAGGGQLHIRLVVMFSLIASIPIILTVIGASVMFQSGVQLWGSERARTAFESSTDLAIEGQRVVAERWAGEARAMADDLIAIYPDLPGRSASVQRAFLEQTYLRNFYQAVLFHLPDGKNVEPLYAYEQPNEKEFAARVTGSILNALNDNKKTYTDFNAKLVWVITPVDRSRNIFLYVATPVNAEYLTRQTDSAREIKREYTALQARARSLQIIFNAALYGVALLIIGIAMWVAILVADRLVRPISELVGAAREIAKGDLGVRVPEPKTRDEVGVLADAFNQMTERLQGQTSALVSANAESESRRALIEAVMSGVTAGVISIDDERKVRLINASALTMLRRDADVVSQPLAELVPELAVLLDGQDREAVVQVTAGGDPRTLAVKITRDEGGQVLTFDDITQQLLDQRRAAWSDVARRIAHEIKNPLTPIQLAAERLQRRYGKKVDAEDGTFARLTDTIVRQVGDLRRIVDEFSSFARMPKPLFRRESLLDIARQSMFLHEVAHPTIRFEMDAPDPAPNLIADRRQIGQALTNVVKNAVEAIEGRGEGEALPQGEVVLTIAEDEGRVTLTVADNGVGLPVERDRIVEPYMTTRSRGTGLGLAIVKKIVEEHCGTIAFGDRPGGGTIVTICFDTDALAGMATADSETADSADTRPVALTRGNKS